MLEHGTTLGSRVWTVSNPGKYHCLWEEREWSEPVKERKPELQLTRLPLAALRAGESTEGSTGESLVWRQGQ